MLPYLNGLRNGFVFDDVPVVAENQRIRSTAQFRDVVATDWWNGQRPQSLLYRPLTMATFVIDYAIAGAGDTSPSPARLSAAKALPFHVQNVLWHGAASAALFLLILELFGSPALALATAALFAVHPVHTEAVNGIVGRAELMSACFAFLALIAARRSRPLAAFVLAFLALLSKEQAIVLPALALLGLMTVQREKRLKLMAALVLAPLLYLTLRGAVLGSPWARGSAEQAAIVVDNPIAGAEGAARWLTPARVFVDALRLVVFPLNLSADYSYDAIPLSKWNDPAAIGGILALCGLAAAAYVLRRRATPAAFGIAFALLTWILTSNFPIVIGTILGERLLYLPSAGACLVLGYGLTVLCRTPFARRVGTVALAAIVLVGAARTWARNPDWLSNETLFKSAAAASPRSCKALDGYASELLAAGRPQDAVPWTKAALSIYPDYPPAQLTLAKSLRLLASGESDRARRTELRSSATAAVEATLASFGSAPGNRAARADAWNVLGALALDAGDFERAAGAFAKSLDDEPAYVPSLTGAGVAMAMRADAEADPRSRDDLRQRAIDRFERALAIDPGSVEARVNLASLHGASGARLLEQKRFPEALAEFREAARLQPGAARAHLGIGSVLTTQAEERAEFSGRAALIDEAIRSFEHALELEPRNAVAHMNLGIVYLRLRPDPAQVIEHFEACLRLAPDAPQRAQMEQTIQTMRAAPLGRPHNR